MKVERKFAAKPCAAAAVIAIMSAASLPGCAVAMLRGAAGSGGGSGGGSAAPASAPASQAADGSLSTAVRSRFGADPALKALKIVVDTHDGIVTLRGQVNTVEQRNAAQAQARAVNGVKGVNNQLTVR